MAAEAATGKAYFHSSTDIHGRPVIVIRVNKHITSAWLHCRAPLRTEWQQTCRLNCESPPPWCCDRAPAAEAGPSCIRVHMILFRRVL